MTVDFFRANEHNEPTAEFFLFTDQYALIMNGMYIEQNGQHYQVTGQQNPDKKGDAHIVFIYPVNRRPTEIQL